MRQNNLSSWKSLDATTILLFYAIVFIGWFSIYAAIYDPAEVSSMFSVDNRAGRQFLWLCLSIIIGTLVLVIDYRFWLSTPIIFYGIILILLILVLFMSGTNGATSWIPIGPFKLQPSEFAKVTTSLLLAKYLDEHRVKIGINQDTFIVVLIILIPTVLILAQNETGTVLVFTCYVIVLYREGLTPIIPLLGVAIAIVFYANFALGFDTVRNILILLALASIALNLRKRKGFNKKLLYIILGFVFAFFFLYSINYIVEEIMQSHHQRRIYALFDPDSYAKNEAYQAMNAMYTIGHGGFSGVGHLKGDLTQLGLVPEQFTDFILCTIGEEHGWIGMIIVISLYVFFLSRLIIIAERQKAVFARVYGYSVACILFFHFMINIGMEIGFLPVIGIPLPMLSYGGSSLWAFTILVFILLKFDMHRGEILART